MQHRVPYSDLYQMAGTDVVSILERCGASSARMVDAADVRFYEAKLDANGTYTWSTKSFDGYVVVAKRDSGSGKRMYLLLAVNLDTDEVCLSSIDNKLKYTEKSERFHEWWPVESVGIGIGFACGKKASAFLQLIADKKLPSRRQSIKEPENACWFLPSSTGAAPDTGALAVSSRRNAAEARPTKQSLPESKLNSKAQHSKRSRVEPRQPYRRKEMEFDDACLCFPSKQKREQRRIARQIERDGCVSPSNGQKHRATEKDTKALKIAQLGWWSTSSNSSNSSIGSSRTKKGGKQCLPLKKSDSGAEKKPKPESKSKSKSNGCMPKKQVAGKDQNMKSKDASCLPKKKKAVKDRKATTRSGKALSCLKAK
ncbi:hypothetical protein FVE85_6840 [Porphyridium purpureum]|uniref:WH1 domain-containing protein n=1 Tax=Porphyridium purpureum TaxID=35688 RepID=A0A5J4Z7E4_PORPP|nr:hypothetical protein FVE85_6840 [Porphyridium purpureum]|eukprot:POR5968..scf295_1